MLNKQRTTNSYKNGEFTKREKLIKLGEYVAFGRLEVGTKLLIGDVDENGVSVNTKIIWIGDATLYHCPTTSDGEIGWVWDRGECLKYVLEIHKYD